MAKWTQEAREAYHKEHPENFAEPDMTYPIKDASDVEDAAGLIGHADNPDAVKHKIIEIAKRLGFSKAIPDAWQESPKETRSMLPQSLNFYVPIDRIDAATREVVGVATAEVEDGHGTVFRYEGSKDAFTRWRGNIREMHDPKKAVGRALDVTPDDDGKKIIVRAKISAGAEDTWQKVLDGTLTGFSVGGRNGTWGEIDLGGRKVPCLERYDLSELSLVDNPSNPEANISIVRADGTASDVLAVDEEQPEQAQEDAPNPGGESEESRNEQPEETRAGQRISADTQAALHEVRDGAMQTAMKAANTCGCDDCMAKVGMLAEHDDNDGDVDANALAQPSRELIADIARQVKTEVLADLARELRAHLSPTTSRVNALLARDASRSETPDITRRVDALDASLAEVLSLVKKIADQPQGGGPMLAMDKRLATQPQSRSFDDTAAIQRAMELGFAPPDGQEAQTRAAAALISRIPR